MVLQYHQEPELKTTLFLYRFGLCKYQYRLVALYIDDRRESGATESVTYCARQNDVSTPINTET